jgi:hypothetical protein
VRIQADRWRYLEGRIEMSENERNRIEAPEQVRRRLHKEIREWLNAITMGPPYGEVTSLSIKAESTEYVLAWYDVAVELEASGLACMVKRRLSLHVGQGTVYEGLTIGLSPSPGSRGPVMVVLGPDRIPTESDYARLMAQREPAQ